DSSARAAPHRPMGTTCLRVGPCRCVRSWRGWRSGERGAARERARCLKGLALLRDFLVPPLAGSDPGSHLPFARLGLLLDRTLEGVDPITDGARLLRAQIAVAEMTPKHVEIGRQRVGEPPIRREQPRDVRVVDRILPTRVERMLEQENQGILDVLRVDLDYLHLFKK